MVYIISLSKSCKPTVQPVKSISVNQKSKVIASTAKQYFAYIYFFKYFSENLVILSLGIIIQLE